MALDGFDIFVHRSIRRGSFILQHNASDPQWDAGLIAASPGKELQGNMLCSCDR